jgi:WD40 repeat protein
MRKMLDSELEYFLNPSERPNLKLTKKQILKIEEKENFIANMNQYSHIYLRYLELQETIKMSSKHNTSKNLLFGNLPSQMSSMKSNIEKIQNKNSYIDKTLNFITVKMNHKESEYETSNNIINEHGIRLLNKEQITNIDKEVLFASQTSEKDDNISMNLNLFSINMNSNRSNVGINNIYTQNNPTLINNSRIINQNNSANLLFNNSNSHFLTRNYEADEISLKNKIKEIKDKKVVRGLTSIFVNRESRKILVNSMSNTQYLYDSLYWDKYSPIELKGHKSSFCVKSVLSPNGEYVLSGSSDANIYIWNASESGIEPIRLTGFHSMEVGAVDWGRNDRNFIASACDNGFILIWDDK